jgi:Holliday junction resolvase
MTPTEWEETVVKECRDFGFISFRITPAPDGGQPCDVVALGRDCSVMIECKVCKGPRFNLRRIEDNQILTLHKCLEKGVPFVLAVQFCSNEEYPFIGYIAGCDLADMLIDKVKSIIYTNDKIWTDLGSAMD